MLFAALILQAAVFAPPLDAPLRVVTERRDDDRRYRLERELRFAREGQGYRAQVILHAATGETPDGSGALYEAGYAALVGRAITFHLDSVGGVTAVDDMPTLWERFCQRIAQVAAERRVLAPAERARLAARIATPLRALPEERRRKMLASLVSVVIADEEMIPGTAPVRLPARSAYGNAAPLDGMRTVAPLPGGLVRSTTRADGAGTSLERVADIDPRTGLVTRTQRILRVRAEGMEKVSTTLVTVERLPGG